MKDKELIEIVIKEFNIPYEYHHILSLLVIETRKEILKELEKKVNKLSFRDSMNQKVVLLQNILLELKSLEEKER